MFLERLRRLSGGMLVAIAGFSACRSPFAECQMYEHGLHMKFPIVLLLSTLITGWILGFLSPKSMSGHVAIFGVSGMMAISAVYVQHEGSVLAILTGPLGFVIGTTGYLGAQIFAELSSRYRSTPYE